MESASRRSRQWELLFVFAILLLAAYWPAMQGHFLMSDTRVVSNNPRLESLNGLRSIWSPSGGDGYPVMDQYQPLTYTLFWLERQIFGLEARAFQAVGLLLHALNSFLVWKLLVRIGARGALLAAAVFAFHPVHVESVAWIYEQKNVLSGAFFFGSLLAYLRFDEERHVAWYATALACFTAALLAKSSTVVLPGVIVLALWCRGDRLAWRSLAPTLPFFALAAAMAGLTIWYEGAVTGASSELYPAGALERFVRAGWVTGFHAGKLLWPSNLAFFYPAWSVDSSDLVAYLPNLAIGAALVVGWIRRAGWGRPYLLGLGWYLGLMFPVMGFFDIFYHQFSLAADHFSYLPSVGLIALLVHAAAAAFERTPPWARRRAAVIVAGVVLASSWGLTWQRSHVFASSNALALDSANKYPKSWLAFQKAGEFGVRKVQRSGKWKARLPQAIVHLEHAVALRPDRAESRDLLATAYLLSGNLEAALEHSQRAVEIDPSDWTLHRNLGLVLERLGRTSLALESFRAMVAASPSSLAVELELAGALARAGRVDGALEEIAQVIERVTPTASSDPKSVDLLRRATELRTAIRALRRGAAAGATGTGDNEWSVLLLTVDTLRPDYLSANGYELPTSPSIDALLAEGVYFEQAVAPVPRTTPAVASLLTGAYPHRTGVRSLSSPLPRERTTLAEALRSEGYQTFAVVTNQLLASVRGFDEGFDSYDAAIDLRDAATTTDAALARLRAAERDRPLFAWVHYIDPHVPYHPPPDIALAFDPGYEGRFRLRFGRQPEAGQRPGMFREFPRGLTKSQITHRNTLADEENAHVRRLYAGDIRRVDREIDRLVGAVRARFPRTVIVFAADHGESLGEHSFYFDHGDYVYNASSRVPLAFILPPEHPWHGSGRRSGWVSLVDVAPTLFEIVGREPPVEMSALFEGRSLAPQLRGQAARPAPVFIESGTSFFPELVRRRASNSVEGRFRAVIYQDWKLIWTPFLPDDEAWELYDLLADPNETRDLYWPDHPRVARLERELERWLATKSPIGSREPAPAEPLTPEDREALRGLGYIE